MSNLVKRGAEAAIVFGTLLGVGSCSVDIATCPGDVEHKAVGSDAKVPVIYCDENPEEDGGFDRPGTPEQKLMYVGFGLAAAGVVARLVVGDEQEPDEAHVGPIGGDTSHPQES